MDYRANVGIAVFNRMGLVFAGKCFSCGPEIVSPGFEWQMPQGGIQPGEDIEAAARRELFEETSIRSVALLAILSEPLAYDFPPYSGPPHRLAAYCGQTQRWAAFRFEGADEEINIHTPSGQEAPEFLDWRWCNLQDLPQRVVIYKRAVYEKVARAFSAYSHALKSG